MGPSAAPASARSRGFFVPRDRNVPRRKTSRSPWTDGTSPGPPEYPHPPTGHTDPTPDPGEGSFAPADAGSGQRNAPPRRQSPVACVKFCKRVLVFPGPLVRGFFVSFRIAEGRRSPVGRAGTSWLWRDGAGTLTGVTRVEVRLVNRRDGRKEVVLRVQARLAEAPLQLAVAPWTARFHFGPATERRNTCDEASLSNCRLARTGLNLRCR